MFYFCSGRVPPFSWLTWTPFQTGIFESLPRFLQRNTPRSRQTLKLISLLSEHPYPYSECPHPPPSRGDGGGAGEDTHLCRVGSSPAGDMMTLYVWMVDSSLPVAVVSQRISQSLYNWQVPGLSSTIELSSKVIVRCGCSRVIGNKKIDFSLINLQLIHQKRKSHSYLL